MEITIKRRKLIQEFAVNTIPLTFLQNKNKIKPKVLLIEDSLVIQDIHATFLRKLGCEVDVVSNAKEAIKALIDDYDLIFMDIGLPEINGLEASKIIRKQPNKKQVPIVALTAYGETTQEDCQKSGINGLVIKPIKLDEFRELLECFLNKQADFFSFKDLSSYKKRDQ